MIKRREEKETRREKKNLEDDLNLVVRLRLKRGRSRIDGDKERKFIDSSGINRLVRIPRTNTRNNTFPYCNGRTTCGLMLSPRATHDQSPNDIHARGIQVISTNRPEV